MSACDLNDRNEKCKCVITKRRWEANVCMAPASLHAGSGQLEVTTLIYTYTINSLVTYITPNYILRKNSTCTNTERTIPVIYSLNDSLCRQKCKCVITKRRWEANVCMAPASLHAGSGQLEVTTLIYTYTINSLVTYITPNYILRKNSTCTNTERTIPVIYSLNDSLCRHRRIYCFSKYVFLRMQI